jgi:hypothetical protein
MQAALTIESNEQDAQDIEENDATIRVSFLRKNKYMRKVILPPKHKLYDSGHVLSRVPGLAGRNTQALGTTVYDGPVEYLSYAFHEVILQAKLAVTKTRAKPPKPPTKGAPGKRQY